MRSWDQIVTMTRLLMQEQEPWVQAMREVNMRYRGDYVIPFPSMEEEPRLPPLTPMLVGEAVDQLGMRAAQVEPLVKCVPENPDKRKGKGSQEWAQIRRKALYAVYEDSMWALQRSRVCRQIVAYNTCALIVLPDFRRKMPRIQARDPLSSFCEAVDPSTPRPPEYGAFVTRHSGDWLRKQYPVVRAENGGPITANNPEYQWDFVEWVDCDQIVFGLLGPQWNSGDHIDRHWQNQPSMLLAGPYPVMCEYPIAVQPRSVTLSGMASRLSNMLGMIDLQAKMQGLDILAQQKAIFPDTYAIGRQNGSPSIAGGGWKDGASGEINLLTDVEQVGMLRTDVGPQTQQTIDRMERNFRTSTGLSPFFGGETYNSLRTGRAMDSMTNMSVDPRIMEIHNLLSAWMPYVNTAVLDTWKQMWPNKTYHLSTGLAGDQAVVEFETTKHIENCENSVRYAFPGSDVTQQTQILGSLLGTNAISLQTMRELHPWVNDFEGEGELVKAEQLEAAMMGAVVAQIQQGALPLPVLAMIWEKVQGGEPLMSAIIKAEDEIKRRQAEAAPPPEQGQLASPETMPGMAAGPAALMQAPQQAPAPPGPTIAPDQDVQGMRALMQQMGAA